MKNARPATALQVFDSPAAIGEYLAERLLAGIVQSQKATRHFLLGCPTGRTPRPIYDALAKRIAATKQDVSHVILVMMDEYLMKTAGGFEYAPADASWSCHHFARVEMLEQWNPRGNLDHHISKEGGDGAFGKK